MKPEVWAFKKGPRVGGLPVIVLDVGKERVTMINELEPPLGPPRAEPRVRIMGVSRAEAAAWFDPKPNEPVDILAKIYLHHAVTLGATPEVMVELTKLTKVAAEQVGTAVLLGERTTAPFDTAEKPPKRAAAAPVPVPEKVKSPVPKLGRAPPTPGKNSGWGAPALKSVSPKRKYGW